MKVEVLLILEPIYEQEANRIRKKDSNEFLRNLGGKNVPELLILVWGIIMLQ